MKKLSLILVAVMLCMSFAACGGGKAPVATPEPTPAPSPVPYNENDIVVSLDGDITTDMFGTPQIPITITNGGSYEYNVTIESISVNGISEVDTSTGKETLASSSVIYEGVAPGETVESNIMFLAGIWEFTGLKTEDINEVVLQCRIEDAFGYANYTQTITKNYK